MPSVPLVEGDGAQGRGGGIVRQGVLRQNAGLRDRAIRRRDAGGDDPPLSRYLRDSGVQPLTPSVRTHAFLARSGFPEIPARRGPLCLSVSGGRLRLRRRDVAHCSPAAGAWDEIQNASCGGSMPSDLIGWPAWPAPLLLADAVAKGADIRLPSDLRPQASVRSVRRGPGHPPDQLTLSRYERHFGVPRPSLARGADRIERRLPWLLRAGRTLTLCLETRISKSGAANHGHRSRQPRLKRRPHAAS